MKQVRAYTCNPDDDCCWAQSVDEDDGTIGVEARVEELVLL